MRGERGIDRHNAQTNTGQELTFDQLLDSMSPREIRARIRAAAKEERSFDETLNSMSPKQVRAHIKAAVKEEQTFDEALDSMSPRQVRSHIRAFAMEEKKHKQEEAQLAAARQSEMVKPAESQSGADVKVNQAFPHQTAEIMANDSQPTIKMTYDKSSHSYVTDDGYILPANDRSDRLSGYILQDQLHQIADIEEKQVVPGPENIATQGRQTTRNVFATQAFTGNSTLNYRNLANNISARELYAPESGSCSEMAVSIDTRIAGLSGGSFTLYDKQNDQCRLAQTVQKVCSLPSALAADAQKAKSINEMLLKTDAASRASDYCVETVDAVEKEKARLAEDG